MTSRGGFRPNGLIGRDYPLKGPYLFYHQDDIDTGAGWPVQNVPGSSRNIGSLPNSGLAGSDYNLDFQMDTAYSTFESLVYRTYSGVATKTTFSLGSDATIIGELGGSVWEGGPFTCLWGCGDFINQLFPVGSIAGSHFTGMFNQFQMFPRFSGVSTTYTFDQRFLLDGSTAPSASSTHINVSAFAPQLNAAGTFQDDAFYDWDAEDFNGSYAPDFYEKLHGVTVDPSLGFNKGFVNTTVVNDSSPQSMLANSYDDYDFNNFRGIPQGSTTQGYAAHIRGWYNYIEMIEQYDIDPGATPVCNQIKAMGLWRGTPTQADLVAIAAEMGI
jgi:hypothetical protein